VLKLSAGDAHELNHIISVLLGYDEDDTAQKEDNNEQKNKIVALLEDTAYSHLLEVLFFLFLFLIGIQFISFILIRICHHGDLLALVLFFAIWYV
jgi:hypothetical protein